MSKEILGCRECGFLFETEGNEGNATRKVGLGEEVNLDYRCLCLATYSSEEGTAQAAIDKTVRALFPFLISFTNGLAKLKEISDEPTQ